MDKITIVMAYYENGGMLDIHFKEWETYPKKYKPCFEAIIVDDGSQKDPAINHFPDDLPFPVSLYRINEDIPWNQNGARNLAMTNADGWCLLTDMDHLLPVDQVSTLIKMRKEYGSFYRPLRKRAVDSLSYKQHPNTYVLHRDLYWQAGGFDEAYAGYYGTDSTFRKRLISTGQKVECDSLTLTLYGREVIADASTTNYGRKGSEYHVSQNLELAERKKLCPDPIQPLNFSWWKVR